jgi:hypothetical protein
MISIELVLSANNLKPTEQQKSLKQNWKKKKIKNDTKKNGIHVWCPRTATIVKMNL